MSHRAPETSEDRDGGPHALLVGLGDRAFVDRPVGVADRFSDAVTGWLPGQAAQLVQFARHDLHRHLARDFTRGMTAHAIGDDEQSPVFRGVSEERVFIARTHHAHVTSGRDMHIHYAASPWSG